MSWANFIETAPRCDHAVQVYEQLDELVESVVDYLAAGFAIGAPSIVIAMPEHRRRFNEELEARGSEPVLLERLGLLTYRDAAETLAGFMDDDVLSAERFERTVGVLIEEVAARFPGKTIRAFGEMVDILWQRGEKHAALALEELWNELAQTRPFALLCGYRLDIFNIDVQTADLPDVFCTHTHVRPATDPSRLAAAVDRALTEVVGSRKAAHVYLEVAERVPRGHVPRAQAVLTFLSTTDTLLAKSVLERVRSFYVAAGARKAASAPLP